MAGRPCRSAKAPQFQVPWASLRIRRGGGSGEGRPRYRVNINGQKKGGGKGRLSPLSPLLSQLWIGEQQQPLMKSFGLELLISTLRHITTTIQQQIYFEPCFEFQKLKTIKKRHVHIAKIIHIREEKMSRFFNLTVIINQLLAAVGNITRNKHLTLICKIRPGQLKKLSKVDLKIGSKVPLLNFKSSEFVCVCVRKNHDCYCQRWPRSTSRGPTSFEC